MSLAVVGVFFLLSLLAHLGGYVAGVVLMRWDSERRNRRLLAAVPPIGLPLEPAQMVTLTDEDAERIVMRDARMRDAMAQREAAIKRARERLLADGRLRLDILGVDVWPPRESEREGAG